MAVQPLRSLPVPDGSPQSPRAVFCSHCAKPPADGLMPQVGSRVCSRCNLGLLIDAPATIAPKPNEAFLIVDRALKVCGVSRRAEKLLGIREVDVVEQRVTDLLIPADAEAAGPGGRGLSEMLLSAAAGAQTDETATLRPSDEFGVRFTARCGPCGPTPGALLVLELG